MILLALWNITDLIKNKTTSIFISKFRKAPPFYMLIVVFIGVLASGINSDNTNNWLAIVRMRLPFLILPLVFFYFRKEIKTQYVNYLIAFWAICLISSFPVLVNYLMNIDELHNLIGRGQSFDTPIDHIKYSLLIAFGSLCGLIFWFEPTFKKHNVLILIGTIYLILFLHVLAVRSGLAVFYIALFFLLINNFINSEPKFKKRNRSLNIGIMICFLTLPGIAIKFVPSLNQKIGYMMYDFEKFKQGKGLDYSDSERIYTYKTGWSLFVESPILGTGIGDLRDACNTLSEKKYGKRIDKYPHNMFLFTLSGMGILGFLLFFFAICYPLWYFRKQLDTFFWVFNLMIFASFLVENTIQRSYSTAFYLFFILAGIAFMWESRAEDQQNAG